MTCAKRKATACWRECKHYAYRLTEKGVRVAAMFVLFHKRICGPLANSLFHHRPTRSSPPPSKIETTYHKPMPPFKTSSIGWLLEKKSERRILRSTRLVSKATVTTTTRGGTSLRLCGDGKGGFYEGEVAGCSGSYSVDCPLTFA
jgi:hypothetical protein